MLLFANEVDVPLPSLVFVRGDMRDIGRPQILQPELFSGHDPLGPDCQGKGDDCSPECEDRDGQSHCWGPGPDMCQTVLQKLQVPGSLYPRLPRD
ncbi:hypothetical protein MAR_036130 [Mya arenaria]|uniref:Uncharacterized protein n=1 Tax=Mya arenaria TaxID=6604 RepID=A0ABY7EPK7_MYAAR|nr:hypothetical protein MAR_036130 [Mya arenaria]